MIDKVSSVSLKNNIMSDKNSVNVVSSPVVASIVKEDASSKTDSFVPQAQQPTKGNILVGILGIVDLLNSFLNAFDTKKK